MQARQSPFKVKSYGLTPFTRRLAQALPALGLDRVALEQRPMGSPEKRVLAWWLRENTSVTLRWVTERLGMGHYTRVKQAIRRMSRRPGRKLERMKHQLMALTSQEQSTLP